MTNNNVMLNKLINDPPLLKHTHSLVDWYPWGPEAFGRAVGGDKPMQALRLGLATFIADMP